MKTSDVNCKKPGLIFLVVLFSGLCAVAQQKDSTQKKWSFLAEPYLMIPYMNGSAGIGNYPDISVHADPSEIFSQLEFGAMGSFEARYKNWRFGTDIMYMSMHQDINGENLNFLGQLKVKQLAWEISALYQVQSWLEAGIGGRFNSINLNATADFLPPGGPIENEKSGSVSWIDPIVIGRITIPLGDKWFANIRGDGGGFGIGSKVTWQVNPILGYKFSKLFQFSVSYRLISVDYEKGDETNRFMYNMVTSGPVARFGFNF